MKGFVILSETEKRSLDVFLHAKATEESRKFYRKVNGILRRFAPQNDRAEEPPKPQHPMCASVKTIKNVLDRF